MFSGNESRDKSLNAQRNGVYTDRNYADESEYYQVLIITHLPTHEGWKAELA